MEQGDERSIQEDQLHLYCTAPHVMLRKPKKNSQHFQEHFGMAMTLPTRVNESERICQEKPFD
jgi:hypothetical protein